MFSQTFSPQDLAVVALLVLLEGVLSIDNALVLGLLAKRLPKHQQRKALTYGLGGAFIFRFIAIGTAAYLLRWRFVKLLGGSYLLWVALKHFVVERRRHPVPAAAHKVGESSVEIAANYFDTVLGLSQHLAQEQLNKFGFRFFFAMLAPSAE